MKINEKIGIQNEARVLGKKHNELQAFYRKMWSQRSNTGNMPVPAEFSYIFESDHQSDFIEKSTKSQFFQGQTSNFTIFFLEKEL